MQPERWKQVDRVFQAALERAPEERAAFISAACDSDDSLRREVEALLAADAEAGSLIEAPAYTAVAPLIVNGDRPSLLGENLRHYRIVSLVGKGGMGEVYRAEDTHLRREVAIKVLPADFSKDADRLRRFGREARAASALNHPNIITVHEIGEAEGRRYIVTEYVAGETLRQRLARTPRQQMEPEEAVEMVLQIATALSAAHEAGVTHRDIKPENVMVRPDGLVKVLDFGLAKLTERPAAAPEADSQAETVARLSTGPGVVMGTMNYMSPEQARGQKVDQRTDIFSLGVMLYEMIAGRRPFEGATASDVIVALLTAEPPPLTSMASPAPAELERITKKCLEKDPETRYQAAKELVAELKLLRFGNRAGEAAAARKIEAAGARFVWRRQMVVTAMAVVLLAGLGYFLYSRHAPEVQIKSLAVLPLENLSGDPAQDYFTDGMTETLIGGLAKVGALRVSSRTSVLQYQRARKPLADIARELNVDAVVEGSVQRFGERVRITARLIHAPTERHLWGETYERDLRDTLALQSEIARAVIQQIQIKLSPQERMRLASARPVNPTAYDDYLRGRFYANRQNKADNETAIKTLERAVATDPTFAAAHAELAQAYVWRFFLFTPEEKQWEEKAFVAVEKSLSLDPDSAVAHLARGRLLWTPAYHFAHEQAIQEYRRALTLNPSLDEAQNQLALVYNHIGVFDLALQELQQAVTVNPTNNLAQFRIGETLVFQGKYEQALTALRKSPREANPVLLTSTTAMTLLHLGRRDEAAALVEGFLKDHPGDTDIGLFTSLQAMLAALAGEENKAEDKIRSAIKKGKGFGHFHHTAYNVACAYAVMKKAEPAIKWLQAAADDGFPCYPLFENEPYLDHLRNDPRFVALIAKLKEQWEHYRTKL